MCAQLTRDLLAIAKFLLYIIYWNISHAPCTLVICSKYFCVFAVSAGILSSDSSKCGIERHLSRVHSGFADPTSAVTCETVENIVGSLSDGVNGRQLPQVSVMCNGVNDELKTEEPAMQLVTVASQMIGSLAPLMPMPNMPEHVIPMDNLRCSGSVDQIRVFSTELANCAAESVRIGRHDSIVDFHRYYCAVPMSQVYAVTE